MNRPMLTALALLAALAPSAQAQKPHVAAGWPVQVVGSEVSSPLLLDLDGDPELELVVAAGNQSIGSKVHAWNPDGSPVPGWPVNLPGVVAGTAGGDLDGDGDLEVVLTARSSAQGWSQLYAVHHDGTLATGFPIHRPGPLGRPSLGDLDGDGDLEIAMREDHALTDGVHLVQGDGSSLPGWPRVLGAQALSDVTLGDVDGDGTPEVVIAAANELHVLRRDGSELPGFPVANPGDFWFQGPVVLADLDADGDTELIVCTRDTVFADDAPVWVLDHTGANHPGWPRVLNASAYAPPAVADLDGDGRLEVVVVGGIDGVLPRLYALKETGATLPGYPFVPLHVPAEQPSVADVDGDGRLEFVLDGASPGKGYQAYEPNGSITDGWPLVDLNKHSTGIQLNATDVDADGLLELVCGFRAGPTGRSTIFLLETAAPVTADAAPVGTRQFGAARTGVYGSPF